jgi:hypothetical protein
MLTIRPEPAAGEKRLRHCDPADHIDLELLQASMGTSSTAGMAMLALLTRPEPGVAIVSPPPAAAAIEAASVTSIIKE